MTNIGDVIRQIERIKSDHQFPPTREQEEIMNRILHTVSSGAAGFGGSK